MKTLTHLIREVFKARKAENEKEKNQINKSENPEGEIKRNPDSINNQNSKENETENREMGRVPDHVDTSAQESAGSVAARPEALTPGNRERGGCGDTGRNREFRKQLKAAYQRGLRDGRNSEIERRYFPESDGIPVFRGAPSKAAASSRIFSIAKEA